MPNLCWISKGQFVPLRFMTHDKLLKVKKDLKNLHPNPNEDGICGSGLNKDAFLKVVNKQLRIAAPLPRRLMEVVHAKIGNVHREGKDRTIRVRLTNNK